MRDLLQWENGGYFVMRPEIFDDLREGEDLVPHAMLRLAADKRLLAQPYKGFWRAVDTFKDRAEMEALYEAEPRAVDGVEQQPQRHPHMSEAHAGSTLRLGDVRSVVVLAAHPDDAEIGAGGVLLSLAAGHDRDCACTTSSSPARRPAKLRRRRPPARSCRRRR